MSVMMVVMLTVAGLCWAAPAPLVVREYAEGTVSLPAANAPAGVTVRPAGAPDAGRLEIGGDVQQFDLLTIEVAPSTKYRVDLRARLDGGETVERNERAHHEALRQNSRENSVYEVLFDGNADEDAKSVVGGGFILTGEWCDYVHVFYTPSNARTLTIRLRPRRHTTLVSRVALAPADEDGAINANPDFRYGELNYCGWRPQRDGRIYRRPDGKCVFNAGYGGSSPRFPLQPGKSYTATAHGEGGQVTLNYFDDQGRKTSGRFLMRPAQEGAQATFTPPDGTAAGGIVMYGGTVLESFKVEESGAPAANNPQE